MRVAILVSTLALAACNSAEAQGGAAASSGPITQRSYDLAGFQGVGLAGSQNVIVTVGPAYSVRAEGDAESLDRLDIRVENGTLKIGAKKNSWSIGWNSNRPHTTVYVSAPALASAAIAGSGDMRIDRVQGQRFAASIAGSGDMDIAALRVGEAKFSIAGSGGIKAAGSAEASSISVAGSGDLDLERLEARTASISIMGSGGVRARAMETANVSVMGSGDVDVTGTARCTVNKRGSGGVRCGA